MAKPELSASQFTLYKTGDLVKVRDDGVFEYLGRNDFQVKIGGVRIECEEVSATLKTHPFVDDALVTAFDGPFGKALAAYIVASKAADFTNPQVLDQENQPPEATEKGDDKLDNVAKWGAVYDEMYKETDASISEQDPTLNWSGYTDTYSRRPHIEPVIKEWVEWSCEQVSRYEEMIQLNRKNGVKSVVTELGCGNGMLLFRLAPLIGSPEQGRYIGTDISTTALDYISRMKNRPEYKDLGIETATIAAHEILNVTKEKENDMVLCNGVTMYFPSAPYLLETMQIAANATKDTGRVFFGDIQSKRHLLPFRCHVETYHALRRADATAAAVLRNARQTAAHEELSYFDDEMFHQMDRVGGKLFDNRLARLEMRLKRGFWHSEFNRFRYDIELVMCNQTPESVKDPSLQFMSYAELSKELQLQTAENELADPRLPMLLKNWIVNKLNSLSSDVDGLVIQAPNARTLQSARLMDWLNEHSDKGTGMAHLPAHLHPVDAACGAMQDSCCFGLEPEMLFCMNLP
eukprot:TRINITY_DN25857_c0_g1_i1.p1 TRINITY_DN25857_c0_g1~~TRINITY_DN25857_c0_g1_i1.p1  ORF type:complete len:604 (+),score=141.50 TRINITY_DN25857_c0_g1_i1:258-1814(+)